jgi:hypothetical protein
MNTDAMRFACTFERISSGWKAEVAGPVCWALIPFDDYPVPPRKLEKAVRKRCKELAKRLKASRQDQVTSLKLTIEAAHDYVKMASEHEDQYFVELWEKLRSQAIAAQASAS